MESLILNFLLLVLEISLDFSPDIGHKRGGFSETLPEKSLKFVLNKRAGTIIFNLGLMLLLVEVDLISEE